MIDHVSLRVHECAASKRFYEAALGPLGYALAADYEDSCGFASGGEIDFWIGEHEARGPAHVAFAAPSRKAVDAFYQAALDTGGKDNGAPGVREEYHEHYYAAFVLDPDGNNIEAVCHKPA